MTSSPSASSRSARYEPSWPVMPVISARPPRPRSARAYTARRSPPVRQRAAPLDDRLARGLVSSQRGRHPSRAGALAPSQPDSNRASAGAGPGRSPRPARSGHSSVRRSTSQRTGSASSASGPEVPARRRARPRRRSAPGRARGTRLSGLSTCCHGRTAAGLRSVRPACPATTARTTSGTQPVLAPVAAADDVAGARGRDRQRRTHRGRPSATSSGAALRVRVRVVAAERIALVERPPCSRRRSTCRRSRPRPRRTRRPRRGPPRARATVPMDVDLVGRRRLREASGARSAAPRGGRRPRGGLPRPRGATARASRHVTARHDRSRLERERASKSEGRVGLRRTTR